MADTKLATHEEVLVHLTQMAEDLDDVCNQQTTGREGYVRRAAASMAASALWKLVDAVEAGEPIFYCTHGE
jgi:hypothetical protein